MSEEYTLDMIVADKDAIWKCKINLSCFICKRGESIFEQCECATVFFEKEGILIAGLICEDCWNKFREAEE